MFDLSVPTAVILLALSAWLLRAVAGREWRRAAQLFAVAVVVRILAATAINSFDQIGKLAGDGLVYDQLAKYIAERWQVEGLDLSWLWTGKVKFSSFAYCIGLLYYFTGPSTWLTYLIMALISGFAVVGVYLTGVRFFGERVGWFAGVFTALLPSSVLWTCLMLKEAPTMLGVVVCLYCVLAALEKPRLLHLAAFLASIYMLQLLRAYVAFMVGFAAVSALIIAWGGGQSWPGYLVRIAVVAVVALAVSLWVDSSMGGSEEELDRAAQYLNIQRLAMTQNAKTAYLKDTQYNSALEAIEFLPLGVTYFLLSPFPWQLGSFISTLAYADIVPWYLLLTYAALGLIRAGRQASPVKFVIVLCLFLGSICIVYGLVSGNAGTAWRHRTQIVPVFMLLAAIEVSMRHRLISWFPGDTDEDDRLMVQFKNMDEPE